MEFEGVKILSDEIKGVLMSPDGVRMGSNES